jgi:hypothetical protein
MVVGTLDPNAIASIGIPGASIVNLSDATSATNGLEQPLTNDPPSTITDQRAGGHKASALPSAQTLLYKRCKRRRRNAIAVGLRLSRYGTVPPPVQLIVSV